MDELDALLKTLREIHIDTTVSNNELVVEVDASSILEVETPPRRTATTSDEHLSDGKRLRSLIAAHLDGHDLHAADHRDGYEHDHDDNDQTTTINDECDLKRHTFQEFIAANNRFAALSYFGQPNQLPDMVKRTKELFLAMSREIRLGGNATYFEELRQAFVRLVTSTRLNMNMSLPHLAQTVEQIEIMREVLVSDSKPNSADDTSDLHMMLTTLIFCTEKMFHFVSESNECSERLQECIEKLTSNIQSKIQVIDEVIGAPISTKILVGMIINLWKSRQLKALNYLKRILDDLSKLNQANMSFMNNMRLFKETMNNLLSNVNILKAAVANPTRRQRRLFASTCEQAISSTKCIIECINQFDSQPFELSDMYTDFFQQISRMIDLI